MGERVMEATITMNIDEIDAQIILKLLEDQKTTGEYWGIKKHHDKRVNNLIKRLNEVLSD